MTVTELILMKLRIMYLCCVQSCIPIPYGFQLLCLVAVSSCFCPLPPSPSHPLFTNFLLPFLLLILLLLRCSGSEVCVQSINFKRNVRDVMFADSGKSKRKFTIELLQTHTVTGNMLYM